MNAVKPNLRLEDPSTAPASNNVSNRAYADKQIASALGLAISYILGLKPKTDEFKPPNLLI